MTDTAEYVAKALALAQRMDSFATELVEPMVCRSPAYGAPGHDHCAACCYGTGLVITCAEDQALADAAKALHAAARILRTGVSSEASSRAVAHLDERREGEANRGNER